jgi:hypothetical protein
MWTTKEEKMKRNWRNNEWEFSKINDRNQITKPRKSSDYTK